MRSGNVVGVRTRARSERIAMARVARDLRRTTPAVRAAVRADERGRFAVQWTPRPEPPTLATPTLSSP
eukprot:7860896-Lingulodinium_polyedra.AAC.1